MISTLAESPSPPIAGDTAATLRLPPAFFLFKRSRSDFPAPTKRELVPYIALHGLGEHQVLRVCRMNSSTLCSQQVPDRNQALRQQIVVLAHRYRRYGAGMSCLKRRQADVTVNQMNVKQLYTETRRQVGRRKRKKVPITDRQPLGLLQAENQIRSSCPKPSARTTAKSSAVKPC